MGFVHVICSFSYVYNNIILIPLGLIYVLLLVYIYVFKDNFKEELKKNG